jgi:hypothetical protein
MSGEPCCATCDFYKHPKDIADRVVAARSGVEPPGFCERYPQTIAKRPGDWCGEWVQEDDPADQGKNG